MEKGKRMKKMKKKGEHREIENKISENRENIRKFNKIRAFYMDVFQKISQQDGRRNSIKINSKKSHEKHELSLYKSRNLHA